jgi:cyclophilin family peptidyl-prolyl cis-trans isomerase
MAQPATVVEFETSVGMFAVELYSQHAPRTCFNFAELAKIGTSEKNTNFPLPR